jgi:hypothetical protein
VSADSGAAAASLTDEQVRTMTATNVAALCRTLRSPQIKKRMSVSRKNRLMTPSNQHERAARPRSSLLPVRNSACYG